MMSRSRMAGLAAASIVFAGAGITQFTAAGPAFAQLPGSCVHEASADNSGNAECTSAPITEVRVVITCAHNGTDYTLDGPWVGLDQVSSKTCTGSDELATAPSAPGASVSYQT